MTFVGSIPTSLRSIVKEAAQQWPVGDAYVGCSGNFTIERTLRDIDPNWRLHGCDVSIFTTAIGKWLSGQPVDLSLTDDWAGDLEWIADSLDGGVGSVAALQLLTHFAPDLRVDHPWRKRNVEAHRRDWADLHRETVEKLEENRFSLTSYRCMDVREWLDLEVPEEATVLSFPPFDCLAPDHRLLMADLTWRRAGDIAEGDEIVAFEEYPEKGKRCRRWRLATITRSEPGLKECVRVTLENGDEVVCTTDHPWLATRYSYENGGGGRWDWTEAKDLEGRWVDKALDPWETAEGYEAGWLAGMLDGEGNISLGSAPKLTVSQLPGAVADRLQERLPLMDLKVQVTTHPTTGVLYHYVGGGFPEILRALGTLQPERLVANLRRHLADEKGPATRSHGKSRVKVVRVEHLGVQPIQSITTSERTYVGEGYLMHNTGGYEKLYERLEDIFDWPRPTYEVMTQEGVEAVVRKITDRPRFLLGVLERREDLDEYLVSYVKETASARPFYVYAKGGEQKTRFVVPKVKVEPVPVPRLAPGDDIGDRLWLAPLTPGQFEAIRAKYLNSGIKTSQGNLNYPMAVMVDDKMIGTICFGMRKGDELQLTTDLAVAPHDYPKLSKLVVMAAQSKEAQRVNERGWACRVRTLQTAVFSNNPASMKYRGLMNLVDRDDAPPESPFAHKLTYKSDAGRWTLGEALADWKRRWGQKKTTTKKETDQ